MNNYDYPIGADTLDAPWNERENEEEEFKVMCCQSLSKSNIPVFTTDYDEVVDKDYDDEGNIFYDTFYETTNTDWKAAYEENEHYTPLQLINLFKRYLEDMLNNTELASTEPSVLKNLIEECEGWVDDETDIMKD